MKNEGTGRMRKKKKRVRRSDLARRQRGQVMLPRRAVRSPSLLAAARGAASVATDLGVKLRVTVMLDATSGITMGSPRELGSANIDTTVHWIQDMVANGTITFVKSQT